MVKLNFHGSTTKIVIASKV